ncbi:MAG TPA: PTS sugar transporter subunit IIB [Candidatus Krumholzibacteria bacterium]|nr:PTS sugar transporter subunit IIB [Candidatus Krumholzibacteria bacterium]
MSAVLVRIDDRLLHAQVLQTWAKWFAAERVILAHDSTAADPQRVAMYRDLAEGDFDIQVTTVAAAAIPLGQPENALRTLWVLGSAADALRLVQLGAAVRRIQVGGLHVAGAPRLLEAVAISAATARDLRALLDRGVALEAQDVPSTPAVRIDSQTLQRLWP